MELKPCPFCGAPGRIQTERPYRGKRTRARSRVIDSNLKCHIFPATHWCDTKEKACTAWNLRQEAHT